MMTDVYWMSASPSYEAEKNRTMYCTSLTMAERTAARRELANHSALGVKSIAAATKNLFVMLLSGVTNA